MKLVIEIPKGLYYSVVDGFAYECNIALSEAFKNGTPLPKGHGRLIDERQVVAALVHHDFLKDNVKCGDVTKILDMTAIIEADKEESDEQERVDDYRDRLDELEREEYYESKYGKEKE